MSELVPLTQVLLDLGRRLDFDVKAEVQAAEGAWVDVVWFEKRLGLGALGLAHPNLLRDPVLPVVGFVIEHATALNAKHIKGSVSNLDNLGAAMGVIIVGDAGFARLRKSRPEATQADLERVALERISTRVYAEGRPKTRIVIMTEQEVRSWAARQA
jgi:hypothetical protein